MYCANGSEEETSGKVDIEGKNRPTAGKSGVAELPPAIVVQYEVWAGRLLGTDEGAGRGPRENGLLPVEQDGVARSIPTALRYMPHKYCGMELNNLPVETMIAQINSLLQYYLRYQRRIG